MLSHRYFEHFLLIFFLSKSKCHYDEILTNHKLIEVLETIDNYYKHTTVVRNTSLLVALKITC